MNKRLRAQSEPTMPAPIASIREVVACLLCVGLLVITVAAGTSHNRDYVYATVCADHLHTIAQRFPAFLEESGGLYPPSYVYPNDASGHYDLMNQNLNHPWGIVHWSWLMFQSSPESDEIFQCPAIRNGGAPRTNPGSRPADWEFTQVDQNNNGNPAAYGVFADKQAPRLAYAANAAILPRNKFTTSLSGGPRVNVLVPQARAARPSSTMVLTEFLDNWKGIGYQAGGGVGSKSFWPVDPFSNVGSGFNPYAAPMNAPGFIYGTLFDQTTYGLLPRKEVQNKTNVLDGQSSGVAETNAVGRHHPGGDKYYDGAANFLFIDGSQRRTSVWQSVEDRLWGDRFYSITGENSVLNY